MIRPQLTNTESDEPCVWCALRNCENPYALPCRHTICMGQYLDPRYFHARFLRASDTLVRIPNNVIISEKHSGPQISNDIISQFNQYAPFYNKVARITEAINEMFEKCNGVFGDGMPLTIAQKGRAFTHPCNNIILGGVQKTKTTFHCSFCRSTSHTARNCPKKHQDYM